MHWKRNDTEAMFFYRYFKISQLITITFLIVSIDQINKSVSL